MGKSGGMREYSNQISIGGLVLVFWASSSSLGWEGERDGRREEFGA